MKSFILISLFSLSAFGQVQLSQVQNSQTSSKNAHLDQVKKAMRACTAMTQDGDVKGRNMARNVQLELGDTCVVHKPSQDSITLLNRQIESAFKYVRAEDLWGDVNRIALERTAKSVWSTHMKLMKDEKLTPASAQAMICKYAQALCRNPGDLKTIQGAFVSFQKDLARTPIKFLTGAEQNAILHNELQPLIARANKTCAATKKKYHEIKMAHSCVRVPDLSQIKFKDGKWDKEASKNVVIKPVKPMSQMECDIQLEKAYNKHKQLHAIATQSIELDMQLIVGSKLGSLLITEDLRKKMGVLKDDFAYETCMKGDGNVLTQVWNKDLLKARSDFFALTVKELRKIQDYKVGDYSTHSKRQTLKQYLKTNPGTVAELLKQKPDSHKVYAICSLIKTIQGWDKAWQIVDGVVIGTGVVASIALGFTGIGAPAGAALAGVVLGSTALSVTKSAIDYSSAIHQDGRLRSAVATQQKNLDQGLADLKVSDERKEGYLNNIKFTVAAEAAGFGLGRGLKLLQTLRQSKNLAKVAPTVSGLSLADEAVMVKKMEGASKVFQAEVKTLGSKGKVLSKVNLEQEAKLTEIYTHLSPADAKVFTKKLSGLHTPEEMNAFIKGLEKSKFDMKSLNHLVDSSKKHPPVYIKLERDPQVASLQKHLTQAEKDHLVKTAKALKKTNKMDDAQAIAKLSEIQKRCIVKGVYKSGCFKLEISKLDNELGILNDIKVKEPPVSVAEVYFNAELSDAERMAKALKVTGLENADLSPLARSKLEKGLLVAHETGDGGVYNYSFSDISKKYRTLTDAGFTNQQANLLIRSGLAGKQEKHVARLIASFEEAGLASRDAQAVAVKFKKRFDHLRKVGSKDSEASELMARYIAREKKAGVADDVIGKKLDDTIGICD